MHSHDYRDPSAFKNRRVLVVGMGDSGSQIGEEISRVAKTTIFSSSREHIPLNIWKRKYYNQMLRPRVRQIKEHSVIFEDGSEEQCDTILYCTGYSITFPFFDANFSPFETRDEIKGANRTDHWLPCGDRVVLFKRVFPLNYPNMAFIGVCLCSISLFLPCSLAEQTIYVCILHIQVLWM